MKTISEIRSQPELTDICILIPSWDGYSDLWQPFFHCFHRYWPDCPFPVFLGANQNVYNDPRITMVTVKPETDYSTSLIEFLKQLPQQWIIVWVEDLFLRAHVDTLEINRLLTWACPRNVGHVRLVGGGHSVVSLAASHFPVSEMPYLGAIPKGARYRAGLTVGLWKRETLIDLLRPGESAWTFEYDGSKRSNVVSAPFFGVIARNETSAPISIVNSVRKGRWTVEGIQFLHQEGLGSTLGDRGIESSLSWAYIACFKSPLTLALFRALYAVLLEEILQHDIN